MTDATPRYLVGVDGGGTGCRAAIADLTGRLLGQGAAGPANATTDLAQTIVNVRVALDAAAVGLPAGALKHSVAHVGLAGVLDGDIAGAVAEELMMRNVTVTDDRATSVAGALGARDGVLAAIGTGSTLAAQRGDSILRIGGWGLNLGDQASGAWLGRELLEHALLVHDGLADGCALSAAMLEAFGGPGGIVRFASKARPADYAAFAPRIVAAGQAGQAAGRLLMRRGAAYLMDALAAMEFGRDDVLCLTGGLGPHYAEHLPEEVRTRIIAPEGSALDGALALAKAAFEQGAGR